MNFKIFLCIAVIYAELICMFGSAMIIIWVVGTLIAVLVGIVNYMRSDKSGVSTLTTRDAEEFAKLIYSEWRDSQMPEAGNVFGLGYLPQGFGMDTTLINTFVDGINCQIQERGIFAKLRMISDELGIDRPLLEFSRL